MDDELFFLYEKYDIKPSFLEDFIYKYLYVFKNSNDVDKMIVFSDKNLKFDLNERLMNKLKNARIFSAFEASYNITFFHVTHNNIIDEEDIENLKKLLAD